MAFDGIDDLALSVASGRRVRRVEMGGVFSLLWLFYTYVIASEPTGEATKS